MPPLPGAWTRCQTRPDETATPSSPRSSRVTSPARVIGGVDPDDTSDPAATRAAIEAAQFVVSLEQRLTDVAASADVVLPVAPVADKAGTFVTREGRPRPFEAVFANPGSLPDLRILVGIADELAALGQGTALGFRTVHEVRAEMEAMGPWDGVRPALKLGKEPKRPKPKAGALALSTREAAARPRLPAGR
ncbi:molybdopterin-dependent oxidoreductase [Nocardioides sp. B-3]|uniref:molybdopterin-dependent oxidoreductase n=1 Tax=Nocardioides sp. B-3 TaxID=2895565 RepID=UPI00215239CD|nr:molybdopterin-dependent oxidoreductase [Nocardioides sp. B-3]UUZ61612.1 molybdopterin-dependent oxidoreductase [Nocardioides sp. B-3]